jgi:hypothetical protein
LIGAIKLQHASSKLRVGVACALFFLSLSVMGGMQWRIAGQAIENARRVQSFADVADWLNVHAQKNAVVFANQQTGLLIPAYTSANLWWHFYAMAVPQTSERIEQSAFVWFTLYGWSPEDMKYAALQNPLAFSQLFTLTILDRSRIAFVHNRIETLVGDYRRFVSAYTPAEALRLFPVDYILYDKDLDRWDVSSLDVDNPVLANERFVLYQMKR